MSGAGASWLQLGGRATKIVRAELTELISRDGDIVHSDLLRVWRDSFASYIVHVVDFCGASTMEDGTMHTAQFSIEST